MHTPPQVLIFSQFKIMLDVLEDMMAMMAMPVERVDGSIRGRDRQSAIDRYQAGEQCLSCPPVWCFTVWPRGRRAVSEHQAGG